MPHLIWQFGIQTLLVLNFESREKLNAAVALNMSSQLAGS